MSCDRAPYQPRTSSCLARRRRSGCDRNGPKRIQTELNSYISLTLLNCLSHDVIVEQKGRAIFNFEELLKLESYSAS